MLRRRSPICAQPGCLSPALAALDAFVARHPDVALSPRILDREAALSLDRAARLLCAEAREVDPDRAERMVIALKCVWPDLPSVRRLPPDDTRGRLFDAVVSACIGRFYSEPAHAPRRIDLAPRLQVARGWPES